MTAQATTSQTTTSCDPTVRVTKSLLGYGVIAGPFYVAVSVAQGLVRDGFDFRRHEWSLLANGPYGWIQTTNLLLTGLMTVAFALGMRRALGSGRAAAWSSRLLAVYGAGMVAAGVFRADPRDGFPAGTPAGPGAVSWHGLLHFASAGVGFLCLVAACFVVARRYRAEGRPRWAAFSAVTGVLFLAGFAGVASGAGTVAVNLAFVASILLVWAWMSAVAVDRYRTAATRR
jgi:hypothetical membrane protein